MPTQGVCAAMGHAQPLTADLTDDDGGSQKRIGCCWAPSFDVPTEEDLRGFSGEGHSQVALSREVLGCRIRAWGKVRRRRRGPRSSPELDARTGKPMEMLCALPRAWIHASTPARRRWRRGGRHEEMRGLRWRGTSGGLPWHAYGLWHTPRGRGRPSAAREME